MGKLIVIEGIDGSGKGTQTELVKAELEKQGFKVGVLDFPRYENESSFFVKRYLNGAYGEVLSKEVSSMFYALDRFDAKSEIEKLLKDNDFVVSNRYTTSNILHQGGKILENRIIGNDDGITKELKRFISYVEALEYETLGIPRPDKVLFLSVSPEIAVLNIKSKEQRNYIQDGSNADIHEKDKNHLVNAWYVGMEMVVNNNWVAVNCLGENGMLEKEEITKEIIEIIKL